MFDKPNQQSQTAYIEANSSLGMSTIQLITVCQDLWWHHRLLRLTGDTAARSFVPSWWNRGRGRMPVMVSDACVTSLTCVDSFVYFVGSEHSSEDSYRSCGEDSAPWEPPLFLHLSSLPPLKGSILGHRSAREWSVVWILLADLSTALLLSNKINIFNFYTI